MKKMRKGIKIEMGERESVNKYLGGDKKKMKTKSKIVALMEIAIVLCSVFLVTTLPAIAAEQNQEMQKVSASTITTTSKDDYVLGVYGNANEDDTIDMRDLTYVKLIFFGKKPETELADAKYDGKINPLDFIQIKLIIVGKERELTLIDDIGAKVTVNKPVSRIIPLSVQEDTIRLLGAKDRIVAISSYTKKNTIEFPEISKKPSVGSGSNPDIEAIIELEPDVVLASCWTKPELVDDKLKGTNIVVLRLYPRNAEWGWKNMPYFASMRDNVIKLGYVLGEVENARKYAEWHDKINDKIQERVSGIPGDEKTTVFIEDPRPTTTERKVSAHITTWDIAGGKNIAPYSAEQRFVEVEWVILQNPDVIIGGLYYVAYQTDDESLAKERYDEIIGVPGFDHIKAVKDGRVHILSTKLGMKTQIPIGTAYMAKWFYPDLFEDWDPQAIHQEYVDRFCPGLDFDVREHGVFVYPKEPVS